MTELTSNGVSGLSAIPCHDTHPQRFNLRHSCTHESGVTTNVTAARVPRVTSDDDARRYHIESNSTAPIGHRSPPHQAQYHQSSAWANRNINHKAMGGSAVSGDHQLLSHSNSSLATDSVMQHAETSVSDIQPSTVASHEDRLVAAHQVLHQTWPLLSKDWYPRYHLATYAGWMGVPGGLCFHDGFYHVFYQHHPYSENWGPMHWGHATSVDLVSWEHMPVALAPGDTYDLDGCFSGSAVSFQGKLYIFYTGHSWGASSELKDDGIYEQQCLAVSRDGIHFEKLGVMIRPPPGYNHCRDPKVWYQEGRWWVVCGARDVAKDIGQLLLYSSETLESWDDTVYTVVSTSADKNVFMWECPDFYSMDTPNEFTLIYSPQGVRPEGYHYCNRFQAGYMTLRCDSSGRFEVEQRFQELDRGHDFYAPQTLETPDGRRILIAWLDMWESPMPTKADGWSGMLTLPRHLVRDPVSQRLLMVPPWELEMLREAEAAIQPQILSDNTELPLVEDCTGYEVNIEFCADTATAEKYGLWLGCGCEIFVDAQARTITLSRHYPEHMLSGYRSCPLPDATVLTLRAFFDRSSVEVFINEGQEVFSSRVYPSEGDRALRIFSCGGQVQILSGKVYQLRSTVSH